MPWFTKPPKEGEPYEIGHLYLAWLRFSGKVERAWWAIRHIPNGIWHIITWIPILYRDRDWDWTYLLIMMREKIKRMRYCQEHGMHTRRMAVAKQMFVAEKILGRLIEDDYCSSEWEEHLRKFGERQALYSEKHKSYVSESTHDTAEGADVRGMANRERMLRDQDWAYLGAILRKHADCWWDLWATMFVVETIKWLA